jgi:hypothetical protein
MSRWSKKRRSQKFREIKRSIDNGLYALTLIKLKKEDSIESDLDDEYINEKLTECLDILEILHQVSNDQSAAPIEYVEIWNAVELTEKQVSSLLDQVKKAENVRKLPSQDSIDLLEDLEDIAARNVRSRFR